MIVYKKNYFFNKTRKIKNKWKIINIFNFIFKFNFINFHENFLNFNLILWSVKNKAVFSLKKINKIVKIFYNLLYNFYFYNFNVFFLENVFFKKELISMNKLNYIKKYVFVENWFFKSKFSERNLRIFKKFSIQSKTNVFIFSSTFKKLSYTFRYHRYFNIFFTGLYYWNRTASLIIPLNVYNLYNLFVLIIFSYSVAISAINSKINLIK